MLEDLRPMGLTEVARQLGIDPFEVVRLMVVARMPAEQLRFTSDQVERIRQAGGIEAWWSGAKPATDSRARVRMVAQQMVERGFVGEKTTRADNLWRGLPLDEAEVVRNAVAAMVKEGWLITVASAKGAQVAILPRALEEMKRLADGKSEPGFLGMGKR